MNDRIYSELADHYARSSASAAPNALYDRPTILELAGPLAGRCVLELGCAAGHLTAELVRNGAQVLALDKSEQMVAFARERVGERARVEVADLSQPLESVADESMDLATASLVLHYLADWRQVLSEVFRSLRPGGVFVMSVQHPVAGWLLSDQTDYGRIELIDENWTVDGIPVVAHMWRRPMEEVLMPLLEQGFVIESVRDPAPDFSASDMPDQRMREAFNGSPLFIFVRAIRPIE